MPDPALDLDTPESDPASVPEPMLGTQTGPFLMPELMGLDDSGDLLDELDPPTDKEARFIVDSTNKDLPPEQLAYNKQRMELYFRQREQQDARKKELYWRDIHLNLERRKEVLEDPAFVAAREGSAFPEIVDYETLNRAEIEYETGQKVTDENYQHLKNALAWRKFGEERMGDRAFFDANTKLHEGDKERETAWVEARDKVRVDQAMGREADPGKVFTQVVKAHPELFDEEKEKGFYWFLFKDVQKFSRTQAQVGNMPGLLLEAMKMDPATMEAAGQVEQAAQQAGGLVSMATGVPGPTVQAVSEAVDWAADVAKQVMVTGTPITPQWLTFLKAYEDMTPRQEEMFWETMSALERANKIKKGTVDQVFSNIGKAMGEKGIGQWLVSEPQLAAREIQLSSEKRTLLSEYPKYVSPEMVGGRVRFLPPGVTEQEAQGNVPYGMPQPVKGKEATATEVSRQLSMINAELRVIDSYRRAKDTLEQAGIEGYQYVTPEGTWMRTMEGGSYSVIESLIPGLAGGAVPVLGKAAFSVVMAAQANSRMRLQNPDVDPIITGAYSLLEGGINGYIEGIEWAGRLGQIRGLRSLRRDIRDGRGWAIGKDIIVFRGFENVTEGLQDATSTFISWAASQHGITPQDLGTEFLRWAKERPNVAIGLLLPGLVSSGAIAYADLHNPDRDIFNTKTLRQAGYNDKQQDRIFETYNAEGGQAAINVMVAEAGNRDPKNIERGAKEYEAELKTAMEEKQVAKILIEARTGEDGELRYHVVDQTGKSLFETRSYEVAEAEQVRQIGVARQKEMAEAMAAQQTEIAKAAQAEKEAAAEGLPSRTTAGVGLDFKQGPLTVTEQGLQEKVSAEIAAKTKADSGFARSAVIVKPAPTTAAGQRALDSVNVLNSIFGTKVVFIRSAEAGKNLQLNAAYVPGIKNTIFMDADSEGNMLSLIGHEWTHHLDKTNHAAWVTLMEQMKPLVRDWAGLTKNLGELYETTKEGVLTSEAVAHIVGEAFGDPDFWLHIKARNPSLFEKIMEAILKFFDETAAKASEFLNNEQITDLTALFDTITDALSIADQHGEIAMEEGASTAPSEGAMFALPGVFRRYTYIGEGIKQREREEAERPAYDRQVADLFAAAQVSFAAALRRLGILEGVGPHVARAAERSQEIGRLLASGQSIAPDSRIKAVFGTFAAYTQAGFPTMGSVPTPADLKVSTASKSHADVGKALAKKLGIEPGRYERSVFQRAILDYFLRMGDPKKGKIFVISGGGSGAGKGTIMAAKEGMDAKGRKGFVHVDADEIRVLFPEWDPLVNVYYNKQAGSITHVESANLSRQLLHEAIAKGLPIFYDGTMSQPELALLNILNPLKEAGYAGRMAGVITEPYEAVVRTFLRAGGEDGNQRFVPPHVTLANHIGFLNAVASGVYDDYFKEWVGEGKFHVHENSAFEADKTPKISAKPVRAETGVTYFMPGEETGQLTYVPEGGGILYALKPSPKIGTGPWEKWWKKSVVVDEKGNPRIVFHSSFHADVNTVFRGYRDIGVHFGTIEAANARYEAKRSERYNNNKTYGFSILDQLLNVSVGAGTYPVYLSIQHPLRLPDLGSWQPDAILDQLFDKNIITGKDRIYYKRHLMNVKGIAYPIIIKLLQSKGYDGIVYRNRVEGRRLLSEPEAMARAERMQVVPADKVPGIKGLEAVGVKHFALDEEGNPLAVGSTPDLARANAITALMRQAQPVDDSWIIFDPEQAKSWANPGTYSGQDIMQSRRRGDEIGRQHRMEIERQEREVGKRVYISEPERGLLYEDIERRLDEDEIPEGPERAFMRGTMRGQVEKKVLEKRMEFPDREVADPWAQGQLTGVEIGFTPGKAGEPGKYRASPKWKETPFDFDNGPVGMTKDEWKAEMADRVIREVYQKLRSNRRNADIILLQMGWYKNFTPKLRREFGGFADMFADFLGAFSPQNGVSMNWRDAIVAAYQMTQGRYDELFLKVETYLAKDPKNTVDSWVRSGGAQIRKVDGSLFGLNSRHGMKAALDLWREIKKGDSPKARNFTANLIGLSLRATIDRWAGRGLQRLAGKRRIPLYSEGEVPGLHLDEKHVGGTFGFAQDVFEMAATEMRESGDERFADLDARGLQAMMWFIEKEVWGENSWMPEEAEGGSMEEMISQQLVNRFQIGISQQIVREGEPTFIPDTTENVEFGNAVWDDLNNLTDVVMTRAIDSIGMFMGDVERALDVEAMTGPNVKPEEIIRIGAKHGGAKRQSNVLITRVIVDEDEINPNARPALEVMFKRQIDAGGPEVQAIIQYLVDRGIDGFTMVADPRSETSPFPDKPGPVWGVRFQYVPEFAGDTHWHENALDVANMVVDALEHLGQMEGVSYTQALRYDTLVLTRGIDYDEQGIFSSALSGREAALWRKRVLDANAAVADRGFQQPAKNVYEPFPYRSKAGKKAAAGRKARGRGGEVPEARGVGPEIQLATRGGKFRGAKAEGPNAQETIEAVVGKYYEQPGSRIKMLEHLLANYKRAVAQGAAKVAKAGEPEKRIDELRAARARQVQTFAELRAIQMALPPDIRGRIGGELTLAQLGASPLYQGKAEALADFLAGRVEKIGQVLEQQLKIEYRGRIKSLVKRYKEKKVGGAMRGRIGEAQQVVNAITGIIKMENDDVATEQSSIEQTLTHDGIDPIEESRLTIRQHLLQTYGALDEQTAAQLSAAYDELIETIATGRAEWGAAEEERLAKIHDNAGQIVGGYGSGAGTGAGVAQAAQQGRVKQIVKGFIVSILNFGQAMREMLPRSATFVDDWVKRGEKADRSDQDFVRGGTNAFAAVIQTALGTRSAIRTGNVLHQMTRLTLQGKDGPASQMQAIQYLLAWQNEDVQQRMIKQGWTDAHMKVFSDGTSDPVSMAIKSFLRFEYDRLYTEIDKVYVKLFGTHLAKVEFYTPMRYFHGGPESESSTLNLFGGPLGISGTTPSFAMARVPHNAPLRQEDAMLVYLGHLQQVSHFIHYAELLREVRGTLNQSHVKPTLMQNLGPEQYDVMLRWIDALARRGQNKANEIKIVQDFMSVLVSGKAISSLILNPKTIAMQVDSMMRFTTAMPAKAFMRTILDGSFYGNIPATFKSAAIQRRLQHGMNPEMQYVMHQANITPSVLLELARKGMAPIQYADALFTSISGAIVYTSAYNEALKTGLSEQQADAAANEAMESAIHNFSQPTGLTSKSIIEVNTSGTMKLFMLFMSDPRLKSAIMMENMLGLYRFKENSAEQNVEHLKQITSVMFWGFLSQLIANMYRDWATDDDDDEIWTLAGFSRAMLLAPVQGIWMVGDMIDSTARWMLGEKVYQGPADPLTEAMGKMQAIYNNRDDLLNPDEPLEMVKEWDRILKAAGLILPPAAGLNAVTNVLKPIVAAQQEIKDAQAGKKD